MISSGGVVVADGLPGGAVPALPKLACSPIDRQHAALIRGFFVVVLLIVAIRQSSIFCRVLCISVNP